MSEIKVALRTADAREEQTLTTGTMAWELFADDTAVIRPEASYALDWVTPPGRARAVSFPLLSYRNFTHPACEVGVAVGIVCGDVSRPHAHAAPSTPMEATRLCQKYVYVVVLPFSSVKLAILPTLSNVTLVVFPPMVRVFARFCRSYPILAP